MLWLRIIRPQTLFASVCPVLVGWLSCRHNLTNADGKVILVFALTLISALSLQILSNLINDYYDFVRGTDKQGRVGFKRALAEGEVTTKQMRTACLISLAVAILTGCCLVYVGGWVILVVGLTAILFAWLYTATNHSLSYLGIADIFVFLYYGVIASCGTAWLLLKAADVVIDRQSFISILSVPFYAGAVCGLISMIVLAVNNIRDIESDRKAGKRTFPVRFGKTAALVALAVIVILQPLFAWLAFGVSPAMLIFVPSALLFWKILLSEGAEYNKCLLGAGIVNLCYVLLVAITVLCSF